MAAIVLASGRICGYEQELNKCFEQQKQQSRHNLQFSTLFSIFVTAVFMTAAGKAVVDVGRSVVGSSSTLYFLFSTAERRATPAVILLSSFL